MNALLPISLSESQISYQTIHTSMHCIYEEARVEHVTRQWSEKIGFQMDNLGPHILRSQYIGVRIGKLLGANIQRIAFILLYHDNDEIRTRDFDPFTKGRYVTAKRKRALKDMYGKDVLWDDIYAAAEEWAARDTLESIIAKEADILDTVFELNMKAAIGLRYIEHPKVQKQIAFKRTCYPHAVVGQLHDAIMEAGPLARWDHFLNDTGSSFGKGTYGKCSPAKSKSK